MLKAERVDVIVAVTHLTFAEDRALAERFPEIDVIIGGHEHFPITATENRTLISKAGSEARFVARIDIARRPSGSIERFYELMPITSALPDEPDAAAVIASYEARMGGGAGRGGRGDARAARRGRTARCGRRKPISAISSPTRCAPRPARRSP